MWPISTFSTPKNSSNSTSEQQTQAPSIFHYFGLGTPNQSNRVNSDKSELINKIAGMNSEKLLELVNNAEVNKDCHTLKIIFSFSNNTLSTQQKNDIALKISNLEQELNSSLIKFNTCEANLAITYDKLNYRADEVALNNKLYKVLLNKSFLDKSADNLLNELHSKIDRSDCSITDFENIMNQIKSYLRKECFNDHLHKLCLSPAKKNNFLEFFEVLYKVNQLDNSLNSTFQEIDNIIFNNDSSLFYNY